MVTLGLTGQKYQHEAEGHKMSIDEKDVERFFSKYQSVFGEAINGHIDLNAIKSFYSEQFIAATPKGVKTAEFDGSFEEVMTKGYERYRKMGTKYDSGQHRNTSY
ncbi:MAG: hypothetical protein HPM95_12080 [Alphaproteobacteria bacterium]|nr:hypothetical protein [Alphaproteobacteria bacterium]